MRAKSLPLASSLYMDCAQGSDLPPIFGDLSQGEKLSEIDPPLYKHATSEIISSNYICTIIADACFLPPNLDDKIHKRRIFERIYFHLALAMIDLQ